MTTFRTLAVIAMAAFLPGLAASAEPSAEPAEPPDSPAWSYSILASVYFLPGDDDYFQPTFATDHHWLHLEARRNYEAIDTNSVWAGYNFSVGETVTFEGSAMAGVVFGDTDGFAPGLKATLSWSKLVFYSEAEYVFATSDSEDSFFYAWSELTWAPAEWVRFGFVGQRTRAYQTDRDIQRGVLVGFSGAPVDFTAYWFNPDERSPTVVLTLGLSF
jgi:hypothetical protein